MNLTEDIAIDLGTANTLIIHNDKVVRLMSPLLLPWRQRRVNL